jgi:hypothetical protein
LAQRIWLHSASPRWLRSDNWRVRTLGHHQTCECCSDEVVVACDGFHFRRCNSCAIGGARRVSSAYGIPATRLRASCSLYGCRILIFAVTTQIHTNSRRSLFFEVPSIWLRSSPAMLAWRKSSREELDMRCRGTQCNNLQGTTLRVWIAMRSIRPSTAGTSAERG